MPEKPINIIISENLDSVKKIGTGRYRITLNESLDPSWNEVALSELSLPVSADYYNIQSGNTIVFALFDLGGVMIEDLKPGNYTLEELSNAINDLLISELKEIRHVVIPDYFKIEVYNKLTKITLKNNRVASDGHFSLPDKIAIDMLKFKVDPDHNITREIGSPDWIRFSFFKNTTTEYISKGSPALALKRGILMVNTSWIPPQVSNFKLKENIIEVINLVHAVANQQVFIQNTNLNWFPMVTNSTQTIDISFSDGSEYIDISSNQIVFLQLLVRKKNYTI